MRSSRVKRPREKYHYNPANMSGKTVETGGGSEKKNDADSIQSRDEGPPRS